MGQTSYRITYLLGKLDANSNPPAIVPVLFPGASVVKCDVSEEQYIITLAAPQAPADLGPLVKVELLSDQ